MLKISLLLARLVADSAQTDEIAERLSHRRGFDSGHNQPLVRIIFQTKQGKRKMQTKRPKIAKSKRPLIPAVSPEADVQYSESLIEYRGA